MDLPSLPRSLRCRRDDDPRDLMRHLLAQGVGDGHPVIPPTVERVEAMLDGADDTMVLGVLAPLRREVTLGDVAVCAVLAGCAPDHLPPLVAAVRGVQSDAFNLLGVTTTTGSAAIGMVVHGEAVEALGANAGANCLGPGNVVNASLGRALATVIRTVGAAVPGMIDMATIGQPAKYGLCFAEGAGPDGWPSLHVERGHAAADSAVTVLAPAGTVEVVDVSSRDAEELLQTLAGALLLPVSTSSDGRTLGSGEPFVLVPPEWAERLCSEGWSRSKVREYLFEHATVPLARLAPGLADRAADDVVARGHIGVAVAPDDITLVVAGGVGTKATLLPLWPGGSRTVTVGVTPRAA